MRQLSARKPFSQLAWQLAAVVAALLALPAAAEINDRVAFDVPGLVIVWSADEEGDVPIAVDFVVDTGAGANDTDFIAQDAFTVVTGTLVPASQGSGRPFEIVDAPGGDFRVDSNDNGVTDAADSFSAFAMNEDTDVGIAAADTRTSFYVASNVPFNLDAEATQAGGILAALLLDRVSIDMSVTRTGNDGLAFGSQARLPHSDGPDGGMVFVSTLYDIRNRQTVFRGNQATASGRGSIADQSVRFDIDYNLGGWGEFFFRPVDLSDGTFEIEAQVVYTVWVP